MTWNIFKRVALLEQQVKDLTDFNGDHSRWIMRLEQKIRHIEDKLFIQAVERKAFISKPDPRMPVFATDEIEKEKKRQYQREWYAKNKASKAAREKKNAYARAYYARTKGENK